MVGPNFRVGKKIGCGNFGELKLGKLPLAQSKVHLETHTAGFDLVSVCNYTRTQNNTQQLLHGDSAYLEGCS